MQYIVQYPKFSLRFREHSTGPCTLPGENRVQSMAPFLQNAYHRLGDEALMLTFGVVENNSVDMTFVYHTPNTEDLEWTIKPLQHGVGDTNRQSMTSLDHTDGRDVWCGCLLVDADSDDCTGGWEVRVGDKIIFVNLETLDTRWPEIEWSDVKNNAHIIGFQQSCGGEQSQETVDAAAAREAVELELKTLYSHTAGNMTSAELERVNALLVRRLRIELNSKRAMEKKTIQQQTRHCCVCLCNPADHAITPCGHVCLCGDCARNFGPELQIKRCPICRSEGNSTLKVIMCAPQPVSGGYIVPFL